MGSVGELNEAVLGEEHEGQVDEYGDEPDEEDELERARLGHLRLDDERLADHVVAVGRDEEDGQDGREAHAVLHEGNQVAPDCAQVPALFGEQVVKAGRHHCEQDHEIRNAISQIKSLPLYNLHLEVIILVGLIIEEKLNYLRYKGTNIEP